MNLWYFCFIYYFTLISKSNIISKFNFYVQIYYNLQNIRVLYLLLHSELGFFICIAFLRRLPSHFLISNKQLEIGSCVWSF